MSTENQPAWRRARTRNPIGALDRLVREMETGSAERTPFTRAEEGLCACHEIAEYPFVRFTLWNQRMGELTGYTMEEINRLGWYQTLYPDAELRERAMRRMQSMRSDDDLHEEEWTILHRDGTSRVLAISTRKLESDSQLVLAVMEDLTEIRRTESELSQLRGELYAMMRSRAVGEMAASLAHELNQPLAAMTANSDAALAMFSRGGADAGEVEAALRAIVRDAERASSMVSRLRSFLRRDEDEAEMRALDLNVLAHEVLDILRPMLIEHDVQAMGDFSLHCPPVPGCKVEIQQVILNLGMNAIESLKEWERVRMLRIRTRYDAPRGAVELSVCDSGPGFEGSEEEAFRPFYTLKRDGLGLGLPICRRIVEEHGGTIWMGRSTKGGAEVSFRLPCAHDPASRPSETPPTPP